MPDPEPPSGQSKLQTNKKLSDLRWMEQNWSRMLMLVDDLLNAKPMPLYPPEEPVDYRRNHTNGAYD